MLTQFNTIDSIIDDMLLRLEPHELEHIKATPEDDLVMYHHSLGRWIRNTYELWHTSPLTEKWRTDESSRKIVNGIDHSEDHPDAVSMAIIRRLWLRANKRHV